MTFFFNGAQANVTLTSSGATINSIPSPAATQTVISYYKESSASGTAIYTVTAGKTFYCMGLMVCANDSAAIVGVKKSDGTVLAATATAANAGVGVGSAGIIFTAAASTALQVYRNSAGNATITMWGYEA